MRAFSLVELSIVLVILGLLTGGILAGQSLIHAAELRALSAEYQRYSSAMYTFRDKYMSMPGDMNNATRFWLRSVNQAWCVTNSTASVGSPGTCDGNGNGGIQGAPAASQSGEEFQLWRQLSLAGLIEGNYTGLAGTTAADHLNPGDNIPSSKLTNTVWRIYTPGVQANMFTLPYETVMIAGASQTGVATMKSEDLWNIDSKMDDGRPSSGKIIARPWSGCTTAASATDYGASYNPASASLCMLVIPRILSN